MTNNQIANDIINSYTQISFETYYAIHYSFIYVEHVGNLGQERKEENWYVLLVVVKRGAMIGIVGTS